MLVTVRLCYYRLDGSMLLKEWWFHLNGEDLSSIETSKQVHHIDPDNKLKL